LSPRRAPPDFSRIRHALRSGQLVNDRVFDEIYPVDVQRASSVHWTPVEVAVRAAKLLAPKPGAVLLDVGAGVGKFCIVAAASVEATVEGVEHRPHFVEVGRAAAAKVGVDVRLVRGTLANMDPARIDGLYLFNPFAENLCAPEEHLDDTVELCENRFWQDVDEAQRFLRAVRPGTRLVTYCGWGGLVPDDYVLASREQRGGTVELWIKTEGYSRARETEESGIRIRATKPAIPA
jgi:SAM-dependent methyltransferase